MQAKRFFSTLVSRAALILGVLALVAAFATPVSAAPNDMAYVRVVHASPAAGPVDVYVDGTALLTDFTFGTVTNYVSVAAGSRTIQVGPTGKGSSAAVMTQSVSVASGGAYTVAAIGTTASGFGLQAFVDNNLMSGSGAKVRVYHLSPNAGPVNVAAGGKTVITGLTYKNASDYLTVPAGTYTFNVTATQAGATVPVAATLNEGTVDSVFAVGLYKGTPALKFVLGVANAVPGMPQTGSDPHAVPSQPSNPATPWIFGLAAIMLLSGGFAAGRFSSARHK